jgi:hypothetical protein
MNASGMSGCDLRVQTEDDFIELNVVTITCRQMKAVIRPLPYASNPPVPRGAGWSFAGWRR